MPEGRRGIQRWLLMCMLVPLLWVAPLGLQAVGGAFVTAGTSALLGQDPAWPFPAPSASAPTGKARSTPARGSRLSAESRQRLASLKREAILACLKAVRDDTEAVELCARLSRRLSYIKTIIRRQMEDAGLSLGHDL
ncbi:unnamed protein product [Durusdinium trenchii]|uniref:Uncharacterized protein n=1 Tax=Durusdinium trenchii TaxID=1381693 RepID=A0ABP0PY85_9DINO